MTGGGGGVSSGFDVYQDFMNYKSGVYKHVSGSLLGGHAVKIVGYALRWCEWGSLAAGMRH